MSSSSPPVAPATICTVTKADAYGHGAVAVSRGFDVTKLMFDREISDAEIRELIVAFGAAARRARERLAAFGWDAGA